jgi:hypothetical protein
MEELINKLRRDYPDIEFIEGSAAMWRPSNGSVTYRPDDGDKAMWGLLHEVGHAILRHQNFVSDVDLLDKEVAAWSKAGELAAAYGIKIDENHEQDCLDTYRDWLHKRSMCPSCALQGLQTCADEYSCPYCRFAWNVTDSRLHRPYRRSKTK